MRIYAGTNEIMKVLIARTCDCNVPYGPVPWVGKIACHELRQL
jgi:hypothetical protein